MQAELSKQDLLSQTKDTAVTPCYVATFLAKQLGPQSQSENDLNSFHSLEDIVIQFLELLEVIACHVVLQRLPWDEHAA